MAQQLRALPALPKMTGSLVFLLPPPGQLTRPPISSQECQDYKCVPPPSASRGFWRFEITPSRLRGKHFTYSALPPTF
ncbi:hypothetical protein LEMLEM_LOCUS27399 [Lemmus lemmus]